MLALFYLLVSHVKSQTLLNHMQGFKSKIKEKRKQNKWIKRKLSSVITREESPGFPPGDQVSNGHDMYYVHLLSREGVLETMGNYTHRI